MSHLQPHTDVRMKWRQILGPSCVEETLRYRSEDISSVLWGTWFCELTLGRKQMTWIALSYFAVSKFAQMLLSLIYMTIKVQRYSHEQKIQCPLRLLSVFKTMVCLTFLVQRVPKTDPNLTSGQTQNRPKLYPNVDLYPKSSLKASMREALWK